MAIVNVRVDCSPFGLGLPISLAGMEDMMYSSVGFQVSINFLSSGSSCHGGLVFCGGLVGVAVLLRSCPPAFIPWPCFDDLWQV